MDSNRRAFLGHLAGLGATISMSHAAAPEEQDAPAAYVQSQRTKGLLSLFGLKYPIFQAPVGRLTCPDLAIAVSSAGAMGAMALTAASADDARASVKKVLSATKQPFVVNYVLAFEPTSLFTVLEAGPPVVQFSWGMPDRHITAAVRSAGAKLGIQVTSVGSARAALDAGADYLVCQGIEAGGHVQAMSPLLETLAEVLGEAKQTPVIAAGGIADGAAIRKVLSAGASGAVWAPGFWRHRKALPTLIIKMPWLGRMGIRRF